jgi:ribonuclease E
VFDTDSSNEVNEADERSDVKPAAPVHAAPVAVDVSPAAVVEPVTAAAISVSELPEPREVRAAPVESRPAPVAEPVEAKHAEAEGFVVSHAAHAPVETPAPAQSPAPGFNMFEKPISRPIENPFGPSPKVAEEKAEPVAETPVASIAPVTPVTPVAETPVASPAPAVEIAARPVESVQAVAAEPLKVAAAAPTPESEIVAAVATPVPVVAEALAPAVESEPVKAFEPVETKPVEAPVLVPTETHYAQPPAEPVAPTPAPAPVALKEEALKPMLENAGLVWVNTDTDKLRAAREAAAQAEAPKRVVRERKPLPPLDTAPMQQVETGKDAH